MQQLWIKKNRRRKVYISKFKIQNTALLCANKQTKTNQTTRWVAENVHTSSSSPHRTHRRRDCAADDGVTEGAREPATETEMPLSDELTDGRRTPALAAPPLPIALALPEIDVR